MGVETAHFPADSKEDRHVLSPRYIVEQHLLPRRLYSSGALLLYEIMCCAPEVIRKMYAEAGSTESLTASMCIETHRVFYEKDSSLLVIRVGMPEPDEVLLSRAVYLCYHDRGGDPLYFTSERAADGTYFLCVRDSSGTRYLLGEAPKEAEEELCQVAQHYWSILKEKPFAQIELEPR